MCKPANTAKIKLMPWKKPWNNNYKESAKEILRFFTFSTRTKTSLINYDLFVNDVSVLGNYRNNIDTFY
jgi:hypothetical protein